MADGINTSFTYEVVPVGDVSVYRLRWRGNDVAASVVDAFGDILASAPDEFSLRLGVSAPPAADRDQGIATIALGQYFGPSAELLELLAPALRIATPIEHTIEHTIEDSSYADARVFLALEAPPNHFLERSSFAPAPLPGTAVATIIDQLLRAPASSGAHYLTMFSWGGAINRLPSDATAFVHREGLFLLATGTEWEEERSQRVVDADLDWVSGFWTALQPDVLPFSYQNFADPELGDWQRAYYGDNLDRLVQVKTAVDPDDVFRFAQSIPVVRSGVARLSAAA